MAAKVTVIIPTYDRAELLKRAMESVYAQTYRPIELIVINNAGTDDTDKIVSQFKTKNDGVFELIYIKQAKNDRNGARNMAIQKATGEFICFLDDDDEFLKEKLAKQIEHFEKNKNMDVSFTNSLLETDGHTRPFLNFKKEGLHNHDNRTVIKKLCTGNFIPITNVMIRSEILKKEMFDPALHTHEDFELWLRLIQKHNFDWLDEPLSLVHSHTHTVRYDQGGVHIDQINVLFKYLQAFPENFTDMMAKLMRLRQLLTEHYTKNSELTKLAEFEHSFKRRAGAAMIRQLYWVKHNKKGLSKFIDLFKLNKLKNELGLKK